MLERLWDYFLDDPKRLIMAGRATHTSGWLLLMAGLLGVMLLAATNGVKSLGGQTVALGLADLYPALPTWWVPESFLGFLLAVILAGGGIYFEYIGRKMLRLMEGRW